MVTLWAKRFVLVGFAVFGAAMMFALATPPDLEKQWAEEAREFSASAPWHPERVTDAAR